MMHDASSRDFQSRPYRSSSSVAPSRRNRPRPGRMPELMPCQPQVPHKAFVLLKTLFYQYVCHVLFIGRPPFCFSADSQKVCARTAAAPVRCLRPLKKPLSRGFFGSAASAARCRIRTLPTPRRHRPPQPSSAGPAVPREAHSSPALRSRRALPARTRQPACAAHPPPGTR